MGSWRIIFYSFFAIGLLSIVKIYRRAIRRFDSQEISALRAHLQQFGHGRRIYSTRGTHGEKMMLVRRFTGRKDPPPIVVAPWTTPAKKTENDQIELRSFVFAETAKVDSAYGVPMTATDKSENEQLKREATRRLCARSNKLSKLSKNAQPSNKCKQNLEFLRCISCSERDGTWYTAVSDTGSLFGKVFNGTTMHFPNYNDGPFMFQQLDIAIPIAGQDDKLRRFAAKLGTSIKKFRSGMFGATITVRLLVTRFTFDSPSIGTDELEEFRLHLAEAAGLVDVADEVVFVEVKDSFEFSRAKAVNALHQQTYHGDSSVLAVVDVDLSIKSKFLRNALTYPFPNGTLAGMRH